MPLTRRHFLKCIGFTGAGSATGCIGFSEPDLSSGLSIDWISESSTDYSGNHHSISVVDVDGDIVICAPLNGQMGSNSCGVVGIDAGGKEIWRNSLSPNQCHAHAVGDVGVGDVDGDQQPEFIMATRSSVSAMNTENGELVFDSDLLDSIPYSAPVTGTTSDDSAFLVVVDFVGNISVVSSVESIKWRHSLDQPVYTSPLVEDFTGNGEPNIAVLHGRNPANVTCFDSKGEVVWSSEQLSNSLTWSSIERGDNVDIALAVDQSLLVLDGMNGETRWSKEIGDKIRVGESNETDVYITAKGGDIHAHDIMDGGVKWSQRITTEETDGMHPENRIGVVTAHETNGNDLRMNAPALGHVSPDSNANVVASAYDGTVAVLDAVSGEIQARIRLDANIYTKPVTADLDGDGYDEIIVLYGDGRIAALRYDSKSINA